MQFEKASILPRSAFFISDLSDHLLAVAQMVKNLPAMQETGFDPCVPNRREWLPTPIFLLGEFCGQRSQVGYSPWEHKESNITEWLTQTDNNRSFTRPAWGENTVVSAHWWWFSP